MLRKINFYLFSWNLKLHREKKEWWPSRISKKVSNVRFLIADCVLDSADTGVIPLYFKQWPTLGKKLSNFLFLGRVTDISWGLLIFQGCFEGHRCQHDWYVPSWSGRTKPASYEKKVLRSSLRIVASAKNFNLEDGAARKSKMADSLKTTRTK